MSPFLGLRLCVFNFCAITTQAGPPLLICLRDAIVSSLEESGEDIFQPLVAQECTFKKKKKKSADGTLAAFPAPPVARRFSCCNLWWLRFCPHLSRCRGQHLKPVISSGCKPESESEPGVLAREREGGKKTKKKKAQLTVLITRSLFLFSALPSCAFLPSFLPSLHGCFNCM